jgi:hypothetical protein
MHFVVGAFVTGARVGGGVGGTGDLVGWLVVLCI